MAKGLLTRRLVNSPFLWRAYRAKEMARFSRMTVTLI